MAKKKQQQNVEQEIYITNKEMSSILTDIQTILNSAKEVQEVVGTCVDFIQQQQAEPGTDMAVELYKCKQESIFTRLHADSIVDSLDFLKRKITRMQQLYTIQKVMEKQIQDELIRKNKEGK